MAILSMILMNNLLREKEREREEGGGREKEKEEKEEINSLGENVTDK